MTPTRPTIKRVRFEVEGLPVAEGSMRGFVVGSRAVITHDRRPHLLLWREAVREAARLQGGGLMPNGPVSVWLSFRLPRPKSHFLPVNRSRPRPVLRPDAPLYPSTKPDLDKLTRAVFDAMTGVVFDDDAQVALMSVGKKYGDPGVAVEVTAL